MLSQIDIVSSKTDLIVVEIIRNRLDRIAEGMQHTLIRSAVAVIVKEGEDVSCGIFRTNGDTIAQSCAIPIHLTAMRPAVQSVVKTFPVETMRPGDSFILNDPYNGGSHLPDIVMVAPIFHDDTVMGFAVTLAHKEDIGGIEPGSMASYSRELYQEGLIIPPIPWTKADRLVQASSDILSANSRLPEILLGDLAAQYSACMTGVHAFQDMIRTFGAGVVAAAIDRLFEQAETQMRASIEAIPDGVYRFRDWVDSHKPERGRLEVHCAVEVSGSTMVVDFAGTTGQQDGPINVNFAGTQAGVHTIVKGLTDPFLPTNEGAVRPIEVRASPGSLLNPVRPGAVALRGQVSQRVCDVVLGALVPALPNRVVACPSGGNMITSFAGFRPDGRRFGSTDLTTGGTGARQTKDGIDHIEHGFSNVKTPPVEVWEAEFPFQVLAHELLIDSGGPGRFRGGLGVRRSFRLLEGTLRCSHRHDRLNSRAWGLFGGKPGGKWRAYIERTNGPREALHSKAVFDLSAGDVLVRETGGGGGLGDPLTREEDSVRIDVLDAKVSREAAEREYGVVLKDPLLEVDSEATAELRRRLSEKRGPVCWTFDRGEDGRL